MSRMAAFFFSLVLSVGLVGVALITDADWAIGLTLAIVGLSLLVFTREYDMGGGGWMGLPDDDRIRFFVIRVVGVLIAAVGTYMLVKRLA